MVGAACDARHVPWVRRIYFDYNATTPLDGGVARAMALADTAWGNPSSIHALGRESRALLDDARYRLAALWRCRPSDVVFTGGGTEANNLALFGAVRALPRGSRFAVSSIEHPAVLHAARDLARRDGFALEELPVDSAGQTRLEAVEAALRAGARLVSVMAANNEVGTVQPIGEIGRLCRSHGALFHTDAVQAFGKLPFDGLGPWEADLVTLCPHKFHGPRGAGALYTRSPMRFAPAQVGGAQENEKRAGTENLGAILGLVAACERFLAPPVFDPAPLFGWTRTLAAAAADLPGVRVWSPQGGRLPNTVAFTVQGADALGLLANLDLAGVCASSGSACSAGSLEPSHVLTAMGAGRAEAASLVRLSLGRENTDDEVERVVSLLPEVVRRARG